MEQKKMQNVIKTVQNNPEKARELIAFLEEILAYMPDATGGSEVHKNATYAGAQKQVKEPTTAQLRDKAAYHLKKLGVPQHIKGYLYLETALVMAAKNPKVLEAITKEVYPVIAKKYDTTASRVERSIRHAVEVCWDRGDLEVFMEYFGNTISTSKGKPTNSEFMALLSNMLRREMGMEDDEED